MAGPQGIPPDVERSDRMSERKAKRPESGRGAGENNWHGESRSAGEQSANRQLEVGAEINGSPVQWPARPQTGRHNEERSDETVSRSGNDRYVDKAEEEFRG